MDERLLADLRTAYDRDADRRHSRSPEPWRIGLVDALATRVVGSGDGRRVVDLGCGTGQMSARLAEHGLAVTGIDLSPENVTRTRARGIEAHTASFHALPFDDGSFDGALAFNSLLHVPRPQLPRVLVEIRRVLVGGAVAMVVVWGGVDQEAPNDTDWLDPPRFFSFYSDESLLTLATPGFRRLETRFLPELTEGSGLRLHPQVMVLEAA